MFVFMFIFNYFWINIFIVDVEVIIKYEVFVDSYLNY